jgi:hypothetical protein
VSLASPVTRGTFQSAADARAALVRALEYAGLNAGPVAPDSATPGAAWPQWTLTDFEGHLCDPSRYSFSVYVVLNAAEPETTVADGDDVVSRVAPSLFRVAIIQAAEPVLITFGDQTTMPGVRFRVITRL